MRGLATAFGVPDDKFPTSLPGLSAILDTSLDELSMKWGGTKNNLQSVDVKLTYSENAVTIGELELTDPSLALNLKRNSNNNFLGTFCIASSTSIASKSWDVEVKYGNSKWTFNTGLGTVTANDVFDGIPGGNPMSLLCSVVSKLCSMSVSDSNAGAVIGSGKKPYTGQPTLL